MKLGLKDQQLSQSWALHNGAGATSSAAVDLMNSAKGDFAALVQFRITAPALTTTQLPDTKTVTYAVMQSANADLSSATALYPAVLVQTGAAGAGATTASYEFRVPTNVQRYVFITATVGAAGGDCSAAIALFDPLF